MPDQTSVILAVETSGHEGDLAIQRGDGQIFQRRIGIDGRRHAQTLVSEVRALLSTAALCPSDVDLVAVSNGPGSFTGLRVGVVFAKTFAWANDARLVAVDTLQAVACGASTSADRVTSIIDAQRSELFVNRYSAVDKEGLRWPLDDLSIVGVQELASRFHEEHHGILSGPAMNKFEEPLADCLQSDPGTWIPRAYWVLKIGENLAAKQHFAVVAALEPVYVRRSYAEEKAVP